MITRWLDLEKNMDDPKKIFEKFSIEKIFEKIFFPEK